MVRKVVSAIGSARKLVKNESGNMYRTKEFPQKLHIRTFLILVSLLMYMKYASHAN